MSASKRIVGLVDMDCFYVQVVQRKDPSIKGKPCAVVQYNTWRGGGIIAVSYEARKFGVTRQMRGDEAKKKCPEIILVQVPENRGKVDLTQFREAGAEVMEVLAEFTGNLERASVDEAYMDLTDEIDRNIAEYNIEEVALDTYKNTHLISLQNKEINVETDEELKNTELFQQWQTQLELCEDSYRLAIGAVIANKMRVAVKEKCGFTCSAGIGPNKMLSKIVAGFHKPNQQTLVFMSDIPEMFRTTKMRKIRNLGGKLGAQLEEKFKIQFMSQLVPLSLQELQAAVGNKSGEIVYWLCRGVDHEPVRPRQLPKSIGCSKNFRGKLMLKTPVDVKKWLTSLCEEVVERLEKDKKQNDRVATLFTVGCTNDNHISQSRRCTVVKQTVIEICDEAFRALCEFNNARTSDEWKPPIINLQISASRFVSQGSAFSCTSNLIKSYMGKRNETKSISSTNENQAFEENSTVSIFNDPSAESTCYNSDVGQTATNSTENKTSEKPIQINVNKNSKNISKYFSTVTEEDHLKELAQVANKTNATFNATTKPTTLNSFFKKSHTTTTNSNNNNNNNNSNSNDDNDNNNNAYINDKHTPHQCFSVENNPGTTSGNFSLENKLGYQSKSGSDFSSNKRISTTDVKSLPESPISSSKLPSTQRQKSCQTLFSRFLKPVTITRTDAKYNVKGTGGKTSDKEPLNDSLISLKSLVDHSMKDDNMRASPMQAHQLNVYDHQSDPCSSSRDMTTTINDLVICERCGKRLLAWDLPDHMDFHFAKDLQESLREKDQRITNSQIHSPVRKKAKTTKSSLTSYFSQR